MINHTVVKNRTGTKTYLLKDKEAYIVATSEIYGSHGIPRYTIILTNGIQQVLHDVGKTIIGNVIKHKSAQNYAFKGKGVE